ncbi:site-specific DNA-methyltransferase [Desulfonatronum thioautotrophicum]|uniref:site-specific DNA-methyltransferase n=1 Tax=Desulfonatronum thioautotrophicum TaxID=617001 RepID=UPI0013793ADD|nr:site-specific DNA-methyltransferase [Desulfonatronum thioautotrophicum]
MEEREALLTQLATVPALAEMVATYREQCLEKTPLSSDGLDRVEAMNRLYQFFSLHYQEGDFIVERRYGPEGSRYVQSRGDDTEFRWATEGMYYIKSGDIFTDYPVQLGGWTIIFSVEPETLLKTRAQLKPSDKAHYELDCVQADQSRQVRVVLKYLKGAQTDKQKNGIVEAIQDATRGDATDIKRWLNRYIARNQSDFFIHAGLKKQMAADLDIFIATTVLDVRQLLAGGDVAARMVTVGRVVRTVGERIIAFLASLEDFQKSLWEKVKLVFATRYVITLDRIEKHASDWLDRNVYRIIAAQREEWRDLGLGEYGDADACRRQPQVRSGGKRSRSGQLALDIQTPKHAEPFLPLPIDTANFDEDFKWSLLDAVTASVGLDEALDGTAVHSDNWQALNTFQTKYHQQVKCIYIDPPYNTKSSCIPYKNGYRHASFAAMMENRLERMRWLTPMDGAIFVSIDKTERTLVEQVMNGVFGQNNRVEELIWAMNTNNSQAPNYSTNHEYVLVYARHRPTVEQDRNMFREPKPGYEEVMALVEELNPGFPPIREVEAALRGLYEQHKIAYREDVESQGLDWEDEKDNDPWRGLFNYKFAEYRDAEGKLVTENEARAVQAKIWIWQEGDMSMPASKQSDTTAMPEHPNWRYYSPTHPVTNKPCPQPKSGWKFPLKNGSDDTDRRCFQSLDEDHRIAWGKDEKKLPRLKRMLHEVSNNVGKSVFRDYSDGEKQTSALFSKSGVFLAPKHSSFVSRFILQGSGEKDMILDCFGGSGSTAHAVMDVNRLEKSRRKFLTVEVNRYFETLIVPRLKKVAAATAWGSGQAKAVDGPGLFMRIQSLEQYEDTLENLDVPPDPRLERFPLLPDPAFTLRYRLDRASKKVYCGVERFLTPFGYRLKRAVTAGPAEPRDVDLVESLVYLLGLDVDRMYREEQGAVILGRDLLGIPTALFFRDCRSPDSQAWLQNKLQDHPAERLLTNDPAALSFDGCERFEAIEAIFAQQFRPN